MNIKTAVTVVLIYLAGYCQGVFKGMSDGSVIKTSGLFTGKVEHVAPWYSYMPSYYFFVAIAALLITAIILTIPYTSRRRETKPDQTSVQAQPGC